MSIRDIDFIIIIFVIFDIQLLFYQNWDKINNILTLMEAQEMLSILNKTYYG